jgi:hypothetical protein
MKANCFSDGDFGDFFFFKKKKEVGGGHQLWLFYLDVTIIVQTCRGVLLRRDLDGGNHRHTLKIKGIIQIRMKILIFRS